MSNRSNGFYPRDGQAQDMLRAAAEQGRREGAQAVMQQLSQAFPALLQSDMGPDVEGRRSINSRPFEELAFPVTVGLPGRIHVLGGMTVRLAVAASIVGHCSAAGQDSETACRNSLSLADTLIAMERSDRTKDKESAPS